MTTKERLNAIFCEVFDDETIEIRSEMTANDVDGWDSLSHINLVVAIEAKFKMKFSQKELQSFKNIGDLLKGIEDKTR
ncbi:acyl carrier protein [Geobacter sp.]|uniref:acyl carrier protein n=1 Tax=Geobacter sp. TaxID=46610 RepID=UPI0027BA10C9|nr:acyl carrier protein [Geobacter sp.]